MESFGGEALPFETVADASRWGEVDVPGLVRRNSKDIRQPEIFECAKALRARYKRVAAVGFCYGGWAVFRLGEKGTDLVDCISTARPSLLEKSEMEKISVPVQIMAHEFDPAFTPELKQGG
jgi:dienelactone hydrolase